MKKSVHFVGSSYICVSRCTVQKTWGEQNAYEKCKARRRYLVSLGQIT